MSVSYTHLDVYKRQYVPNWLHAIAQSFFVVCPFSEGSEQFSKTSVLCSMMLLVSNAVWCSVLSEEWNIDSVVIMENSWCTTLRTLIKMMKCFLHAPDLPCLIQSWGCQTLPLQILLFGLWNEHPSSCRVMTLYMNVGTSQNLLTKILTEFDMVWCILTLDVRIAWTVPYGILMVSWMV